jgi:type II secretory pathway pseudopilin PulG
MINFSIKNKKSGSRAISSGGYTLVELLFYIALFTTISLVVINALVTMSKAFRETTIQSELSDSASIMESMVREIRQATSIGSVSATDLVINTTDENDVSRTVQFILSGSNIQFLEDGVFTGNLNTSNIAVTALSFTEVTNAQAEGIKISLTIKSNNDTLSRTVDFYDTVVLRGSY